MILSNYMQTVEEGAVLDAGIQQYSYSLFYHHFFRFALCLLHYSLCLPNHMKIVFLSLQNYSLQLKKAAAHGLARIEITPMMNCWVVSLKLFWTKIPIWPPAGSPNSSWDHHKCCVSAPKRRRLLISQIFAKRCTGKNKKERWSHRQNGWAQLFIDKQSKY